jgi:hypothetical protein
MLVGMDIPAAAAAPWIALGVVLGILLLALAGLTAAWVSGRSPAGKPPPAGPGCSDDGARDDGAADDLAGFLEHPPGSPGARDPRGDGWASLVAPAPTAAPATAATEPRRPSSVRVLGVMAVAALLLVGGAAAVATGLPGEPATGRGPRGFELRLTFGGLILERRAVGVTVTYPELRLTGDRTHRRAQVELPTWNCLADEAPAEPAAAGCRRSLTEYADLTAPSLDVTGGADELRISGRFPTATRPNGTPPEPTGRVYELRVTVHPGTGPRAGRQPAADRRPTAGWRPAAGVLRLGADSTETTATDVDAGRNVLRYGDR